MLDHHGQGEWMKQKEKKTYLDTYQMLIFIWAVKVLRQGIILNRRRQKRRIVIIWETEHQLLQKGETPWKQNLLLMLIVCNKINIAKAFFFLSFLCFSHLPGQLQIQVSNTWEKYIQPRNLNRQVIYKVNIQLTIKD